MSQFVELANDVSLTDLLSVPTEVKEPAATVFETVAQAAAPEAQATTPGTDPLLQQEAKPRMTPEESGEALVAMIEGVTAPVFTALHYRKFKRAFTEEQRKLVDLASSKPDEKRTDDERAELGRFERLEREMKARIKDVGFTDEEYNRLVKPAALMCKAHNLDIPPSLAFALVSLQVVSNRVVDLVAS